MCFLVCFLIKKRLEFFGICETVGVSWHCIDDVLMKFLFAVFFVLWVAWIMLCEWVVGYHVKTCWFTLFSDSCVRYRYLLYIQLLQKLMLYIYIWIIIHLDIKRRTSQENVAPDAEDEARTVCFVNFDWCFFHGKSIWENEKQHL